MNNLIPKNEALQTMSDAEFALIEKRIEEEKMRRLQNAVNALTERIKQNEQKTAEEISALKDELKAQDEKTSYIHMKSADENYLTLRNLGRQHNPPILNKMKYLLQFARVLQETNEMLPYSRFLGGGNPLVVSYKITYANGFEGLSYKYHVTRTWERVNTALEECGLLVEFNACKNKKEVDRFIDNEIVPHIGV